MLIWKMVLMLTSDMKTCKHCHGDNERKRVKERESDNDTEV